MDPCFSSGWHNEVDRPWLPCPERVGASVKTSTSVPAVGAGPTAQVPAPWLPLCPASPEKDHPRWHPGLLNDWPNLQGKR